MVRRITFLTAATPLIQYLLRTLISRNRFNSKHNCNDMVNDCIPIIIVFAFNNPSLYKKGRRYELISSFRNMRQLSALPWRWEKLKNWAEKYAPMLIGIFEIVVQLGPLSPQIQNDYPWLFKHLGNGNRNCKVLWSGRWELPKGVDCCNKLN